ncbi:putative ribokinase, partial [Cooperia oncophora]
HTHTHTHTHTAIIYSRIIPQVGNDSFGESNIENLRKAGVDVSQVEKSESSHTATATITVNAHGENTIVVTLGANMELDDVCAERHEKAISEAALVMTQAEVSREGNKRAFELAKKHGVRTFFNPAPGERDTDMSMVALTDIICTNENEVTICSLLWPIQHFLGVVLVSQAEFITNIPQNSMEDAEKAAAQMTTMGPEYAIVTLGAKGVLLASKGKEKIEHIPVKKVKAVDTTGAGDCFCGSLAYFLVCEELSVPDAIRKAAEIAALSVQRKGTQSSYWSREEIEREHPHLLK